jgi:hypothetical protein
MEYLSDASWSSDSEEEIEEPEDIYCPRELDYWSIEDLLDQHCPPPILEYLRTVSVVTIRECVRAPLTLDIRKVVDPKSAHNFQRLQSRRAPIQGADITFDEFDAMGEYCMRLCEACRVPALAARIWSCMIRLLEYRTMA